MKDFKFPLLSANDIECRIGTCNDKGVSLLLYKDARVDMRMLDEVVGWNNWQREHKELKGNIYCGVSIYDDDKQQWITKWDCGKESNTEAEKGEASDSFKRACVNATGVGRELYTSPFIWVSGATKNDKFEVTEIGYDESKRINKLVIVNVKTKETAYTFGVSVQKPQPKLTPKLETAMNDLDSKLCHDRGSIRKDQYDYINGKVSAMKEETRQHFFNKLEAHYNVGNPEFLSEFQATDVINLFKAKENK